jgi:hypothetical protein
MVIFLYRDKPHKPNQPKSHWFDLDDFLKINRTKLHRKHFYLEVRMIFILKTESNRTAKTLIEITHISSE